MTEGVKSRCLWTLVELAADIFAIIRSAYLVENAGTDVAFFIRQKFSLFIQFS